MGQADFLKGFTKELKGMEGVGTASSPPRYWYSTSNYVLNRIISGSFYKGIPQGRITNFAGPSGGGKSYLSANVVRAAQQAGAMILVIDSENALDDTFMQNVGIDTKKDDYLYADVVTISDVAKVVSRFLKGYKESFGHGEDAPQALILIDSLDMLITDTEQEHYDKGVQEGDQGQKNKQLKQMLRTFIQDIKRYMESFTLQYSDDGATFFTYGSQKGLTYPGNNTLSSEYPFVPLTANRRYWRWLITANDGDTTYTSFAEVELRAVVSGADVIPTSSATASIESPDAANGGVDNSTNTEWVAQNNNVFPQWFQVDLGVSTDLSLAQSAMVSQRVIASGARTPTAWTIECSTDIVAWMAVDQQSGITWASAIETQLFTL